MTRNDKYLTKNGLSQYLQHLNKILTRFSCKRVPAHPRYVPVRKRFLGPENNCESSRLKLTEFRFSVRLFRKTLAFDDSDYSG